MGIPANILAILGILSLGRLLPPSLLVLILSITDAITLLLKLVANQISIHDPHMTKLACRLEFIVISFSTLANWILVGIAVDRFLWLRRQRMIRKGLTPDSVEGQGQGTASEGTKEDGQRRRRGRRRQECVFAMMYRSDGRGFVSLTNCGVGFLTAFIATFILGLYGIVFFNMRDVDLTGRRCVVYQEYVNFWKNAWYWINTGLFFFIPFSVVLILTVLSVRWLLLDKREAAKANRNGEGQGTSTDVTTKSDQTDNQTATVVNGVNEEQQEDPQPDGAKQQAEESVDNHMNIQTTNKTELACEASQTKISESVDSGGDGLELRNQKSLTAMMILAATFFLILSLPGCVFYLSYRLKSDPVLRNRWLLFEQLQFILVDMSHALNFFIYFLAVRVFRVSLIRLLTCKGRDKYVP